MDRKQMIARQYRDSDGFWIELKPGFVVSGDAHGIVENTRREAYRKLGLVVPCECAECKSLIQRGAA